MEFNEIFTNEERICRLCGEKQHNVIELSGKDSNDIKSLVRRTLGFLNIKVNYIIFLPLSIMYMSSFTCLVQRK